MADVNLVIDEYALGSDVISRYGLDIDDYSEGSDDITTPRLLEIEDALLGSETFITPRIISIVDELLGEDDYELNFLDIGMSLQGSDILVNSDKLDNYTFWWQVDNVDLGHPGIKTISTVTVGINSNTEFVAEIDIKYDNGLSIRETKSVRCVNGVAFFQVSGSMFNIRILKSNTEEITIDEFSWITVEYQTPDKRFRRSTYAVSD